MLGKWVPYDVEYKGFCEPPMLFSHCIGIMAVVGVDLCGKTDKYWPSSRRTTIDGSVSRLSPSHSAVPV